MKIKKLALVILLIATVLVSGCTQSDKEIKHPEEILVGGIPEPEEIEFIIEEKITEGTYHASIRLLAYYELRQDIPDGGSTRYYGSTMANGTLHIEILSRENEKVYWDDINLKDSDFLEMGITTKEISEMPVGVIDQFMTEYEWIIPKSEILKGEISDGVAVVTFTTADGKEVSSEEMWIGGLPAYTEAEVESNIEKDYLSSAKTYNVYQTKLNIKLVLVRAGYWEIYAGKKVYRIDLTAENTAIDDNMRALTGPFTMILDSKQYSLETSDWQSIIYRGAKADIILYTREDDTPTSVSGKNIRLIPGEVIETWTEHYPDGTPLNQYRDEKFNEFEVTG